MPTSPPIGELFSQPERYTHDYVSGSLAAASILADRAIAQAAIIRETFSFMVKDLILHLSMSARRAGRTLSRAGTALSLAVLGYAAFGSSTAMAVNLVTNGGFEINGGTGQLAGGITTLSGWTVGPVVVTANTPAGSAPFDFIGNASASSVGFPSVYSPPNIFVWGPNTPAAAGGPVANGFTGSPGGGSFVIVDGGYATAPISQVINGLTIGQTYTLSFDWAGAQASQYYGATKQSWSITFGSTTVSTPTASVVSQGFSGWMSYSNTFTATSTSQTLSFLAKDTPVGILPLTFLDDVSLTVATPSPVPEPASMAVLVTGLAGVIAARRRKQRRVAG